jgi:hypothetical protein
MAREGETDDQRAEGDRHDEARGGEAEQGTARAHAHR